MIHLDKEDFNDLIKEGFHLVDFYAEWCGPCRMLAPILEGIKDIDIIKVDVDKHPSLAQKYGVMSIPTLIFFKDSEIVSQTLGFHTKEELDEMIKELQK